VKTLVHEDCIFECNPLWSLQPVQLTQERSDVELFKSVNEEDVLGGFVREHCPKFD